jgi:cytoskeletal protein RodZ
MRIGEYFRAKRVEKGLTQEQVAALIREDFQVSLLWDFEDSDDDDIDGWPLTDYKRYCNALGIDPGGYADIAISDMSSLSVAALIKMRREEKQLTREMLADSIGYYPAVIEAIEDEKKYPTVSLDVFKGIARELDIPLRHLLEIA